MMFPSHWSHPQISILSWVDPHNNPLYFLLTQETNLLFLDCYKSTPTPTSPTAHLSQPQPTCTIQINRQLYLSGGPPKPKKKQTNVLNFEPARNRVFRVNTPNTVGSSLRGSNGCKIKTHWLLYTPPLYILFLSLYSLYRTFQYLPSLSLSLCTMASSGSTLVALMLVALLVGHTMAQSPAKSPALSPTRSPPASAPSPSSAAPSTPKVKSPPSPTPSTAESPASSPSLISAPPSEAPAPAPSENGAVLNRISASASVVIGLCAVVLVM